MKYPVVLCLGISHRDVELAGLWVRWVNFLGEFHSNADNFLLITHTKRAAPKMEAVKKAFRGTRYGEFVTFIRELPDEDESGYPRSASHLFLRTLEIAEEKWPDRAVFWCEPDTVAMKPTWFEEIAAEYVECGKPFMGLRVGKTAPHLSGNAVYPADWRALAPSIANVLNAPDTAHWGKGKGSAWDVYCARDTVPQMHETKKIYQVWKDRGFTKTDLKNIPPEACLFHQDKTGQVARDIAERDYPGQFKYTVSGRRFYMLRGHESRFRALGHPVRFTWRKYQFGWISAVCTSELTEQEAHILAMVEGRHGLSEISEQEFLKLTSQRATK